MKKSVLNVFASMLLLLPAIHAGAWEMKQGPMMTSWSNNIDPTNVMPEYPRPQMERADWLNLNGIWDLRKGTPNESYSSSFAYDKEILVPFPLESALSGVMVKADEQCYWYRRTFEVPASMAGKNILLHFGAVDWETKVYVNGKEVGRHTGGYDPFYFNITDALNPSGEQELVVYVYDNTGMEGQPTGKQSRNPSICWYTAVSGIWQTVWIEPVESTYIADFEIEPNLSQKKLYIVVNGAGDTAGTTFNATIKDKEGNTVGTLTGGSLGATSNVDFTGDVKTWSPESPYLYDLDIELVKGGKVVDKVDSYCAMRKIEVKKDANNIPRIYLNDEQIFQMGPLDQGWWPDGLYAAPCDEALLYDVKIMKDLGFNMVRKHIKTEPARWYYYCDREGLLVWQDLPSPNIVSGHEAFAKQNFEDESKNIVKALKNYPSIVHWVVFNEGWGQFDTERITRLVIGWVNRLIPSRFGKASLVCCASGWTDVAGLGDIKDSHSYPHPSTPTDNTRAAVCGEYGGITLKVPGHIWPGGDFQYTTVEAPEDFTAYFGGLCKEIRDQYLDGLNAAVYTQISDVEIEKNGIMTYDRKIIKPASAFSELRDYIVDCVNLPKSDYRLKTILSDSRKHHYTWRYTFDDVPRHWSEKGFNDSSWKQGKAGFGSMNAPNDQYVGTRWQTPQIFMRRWFYLGDIDEAMIQNLRFSIFHDDDMDVYLNGTLAATKGGYQTGYSISDIAPDALATLKPNSWNLLAVAGRQGSGEQIMDIGIVALVTEDFDYTENYDDLTNPEYTEFEEATTVTAAKFKKLDQEFHHTTDRNNVAWADFNNDGKLEVLYTGNDNHATSKGFASMYTYAGNDSWTEKTNVVNKTYHACPVAIDYDNDGHLDLFVPGLKTVGYDNGASDMAAFLYHNKGDGTFEEVNNATIDSNSMGLWPIHNDYSGGMGRHWVSVGDYDNDGYQDIVVTGRDDYDFNDEGNIYTYNDRRAVYLYHNEQGRGFRRVENPLNGTDPFVGLARGSVYFADMDNDGLLDVVASGYGINEGNLHVYWNNGDGTFSETQSLSGAYNSSCAVGDLNNDGFQDIVVIGKANYKNGSKAFYLYRNNGDRSFSMLTDEYCGFEGVDGATPALGDVNNDGRLDILTGGHSDTSGHEITSWVYLNQGDFVFSPTMTYFNDIKGTNSFARVSHGNNHLIDYNGDGYLDAWLMGWTKGGCSKGSDCLTVLYQNTTTAVGPNTAPAAPTNISAVCNEATGKVKFTWTAPADDTTPAEALRYNVYIKKADSDNIIAVLPVDPATGFIKTDELTGAITSTAYELAVPQDGSEYVWGVQAIDHGKMASAFATGTFKTGTAGVQLSQAEGNDIKVAGKSILYTLAAGYSDVSVYDTKGTMVYTATDTVAGRVRGLQSGIYFATVAGEKPAETYKLVVK